MDHGTDIGRILGIKTTQIKEDYIAIITINRRGEF